MPDVDVDVSPKSRTSWLTVLLSSVLAIAVTVVGAMIIGKLQAQEPHLIYSYTESAPISGPNSVVSIYQVTVANDGKKEVEGVTELPPPP